MNSVNTKIIDNNGVIYLEYPIFDDCFFVLHACSTRHGGVSEGHFSSMNLGHSTDDDILKIKENWNIFCEKIGVDVKKTVCSNQKHEDIIRTVTEKDIGKGVITDRDYESVDGLVTDVENIPLCVFSADCIPVLFADTKNKIVGAAHCGWKSTYLDLAGKMIDKMVNEFGSNPEDIKVAIGPGIRNCCYEVSEELYMQFKDKYGDKNCLVKSEKYYLDLQMINKQIVESKGVKDIFVSDLCTCCNKDELFSHRGSNGKRGLMVNLIMIK